MPRKKTTEKIYVLDTSVILHDHEAINNYGENHVAIPITVLEELDNFKVGNDVKNFEARQVIRFIDKLSGNSTLQDWIPLGHGRGKKSGRFKVVMATAGAKINAEHVFDDKKNDHKILNTALYLMNQEKGKEVILVSKDINLRLKAKALNIQAEDYEIGKVKDVRKLDSEPLVIEGIDSEIIKSIFTHNHTTETSFLGQHKMNNQYYVLRNGRSSTLAYYNPFSETVDRVEKAITYGIKPKNAEQTFAIHAIMNPDIKLICLQGVAGTGKTLLALAGSIEQRKRYTQIILARPIVPLSNKDIGYLPGTIKDKINPYMEPLWDNLKFIKSQYGENEKRYKQVEDMEKSEKLVITPLAYIRGRSLSNIMFIVDEAQNLTPHEVKTIITRAGENTKIIFTGDVHQIDTPYLDEHSNGLSYLIERLRGNKLFAHIQLNKGERSELANIANELL